MPIYALGGFIQDLAPDYCDFVAIFTRSGFNTTSLIVKDLKNKFLIFPKNVNEEEIDNDEIWRYRQDTLWEIKPSLSLWKYLYVFSNLGRSTRVESIDDINILINRSLDCARLMNCKSIGYIIIRSNNHTDEECAQRMIDSIINWELIFKYEINVYLIDRVNGFAPFV
jgi:hypothetical protein